MNALPDSLKAVASSISLGWLWQAVPIVLSALAIVVTVAVAMIVYRKTRQRKALDYRVLSRMPVLSEEAKKQGNLKLLYRDQEVRNASLIEIKFINTGTVPIKQEDIVDPVVLRFGKKARVMEATISDTNPENVRDSVSIAPVNFDYLMVFGITLLNPKDSFTVRALVDDASNQISVDARIAGIDQVKEIKESSSFVSEKLTMVISTLSAITVIMTVGGTTVTVRSASIIAFFVSLICLLFFIRAKVAQRRA